MVSIGVGHGCVGLGGGDRDWSSSGQWVGRGGMGLVASGCMGLLRVKAWLFRGRAASTRGQGTDTTVVEPGSQNTQAVDPGIEFVFKEKCFIIGAAETLRLGPLSPYEVVGRAEIVGLTETVGLQGMNSYLPYFEEQKKIRRSFPGVWDYCQRSELQVISDNSLNVAELT
ncbi:hypothetical protein Tco_0580297 [Tanacetum coccineum]